MKNQNQYYVADFSQNNSQLLRFLLRICLAIGILNSASQAADIEFGSDPIDSSLGMITFNEINLGTVNPIYEFEDVEVGDLTVSFGSIFSGQTLGATDNSLLETQPSDPLSLDASGPNVATLLDLKSPTPPVLGGSNGDRFYSTPIAIHFEPAVNAVSFTLGSLDGPDTTFVEIFDPQGISLGVTKNLGDGFETVSARSSDINIGGVSVYVTEAFPDWEGFGIDSVSIAPVPEPSGWMIGLSLLFGLALHGRTRRMC